MRADAPVFVAGADRSGTTLMFSLLASHPELSMVRRTNMWRYFHGRYGDLADPRNLDRCLDEMVRYRRMRHLSPDRDRIRREFAQGEQTYGRLFALFHEHHAQREGKRRWGDKSLHTEHFAERIYSEFPDARVVHMVRDARDRYASARHRNGNAPSRVGAATGRWLLSARAARRNRARHPDRYMVVRYEDLVRDPHGTMRRVCAHVGLDYAPRLVSLDDAPPSARAGNSSFGDVDSRTISTRAIGRFRQRLAGPELRFIELVAGRELERNGYTLARPRLDPADRLWFLAWHLPLNTARMVGWMTMAHVRRLRGPRVPASRLGETAEAST